MSAITDAWESFFRNCGLPSNVRRKYAQRFVKERIQPSMLKDIGKSELKDLGVETLGDQLCILRYIKSSDGILDEFKTTSKQRVSQTKEDDDVSMESDSDNYEGNKTRNSRVVRHQLRGTQKREPTISSPRLLDQSRVIRKKPVMIHDVSSSSPIPSLGKMRSDSISLKTMVVAQGTPKKTPVKSVMSQRDISDSIRIATKQSPDFRVRLDVRPQMKYDGAFMDDDISGERALIRESRIVSVSNGQRRLGTELSRVVVGGRRPRVAEANVRQLLTVNNDNAAFSMSRISSALPATRRSSIQSRIRPLKIQQSIIQQRKKPVITLARGKTSKSATGGGGSGGILSRISILPK